MENTTKHPTAIDIDALKNIARSITFSNNKAEPVQITITYKQFSDKLIHLGVLLQAIESIGYDDSHISGICGGLAKIAQNYIPWDEMYFLDTLLIDEKRVEKPQNFKQISSL